MPRVVVTGIPGVEKALEALDGKDRLNTERRALRAAGKPFQAALRAIAASSNVPHSFTNVPAGRVSTSGGFPHITVRPKSPLFNIFEPGAGGHTIAPRTSGLYLRGRGKKRAARSESHPGVLAGPAGSGSWDSVGRKRSGAFFSAGPVRHPGFRGRSITGRAFAEAEPAAMEAFAAVVFGHAGGTPL
jgi:hypothetical protein